MQRTHKAPMGRACWLMEANVSMACGKREEAVRLDVCWRFEGRERILGVGLGLST